MSEQSAARKQDEEVVQEPMEESTGAQQTESTPSASDGHLTVLEGGTSESPNTVKNAKFAPLGQAAAQGGQGSMDLLLDVDLNLSVELGRTSLPVREVLQLGAGSIIELEKMSGEPVDIMVNGKLVARGEVVVIDESFGVRVSEILSPSERLGKLV